MYFLDIYNLKVKNTYYSYFVLVKQVDDFSTLPDIRVVSHFNHFHFSFKNAIYNVLHEVCLRTPKYSQTIQITTILSGCYGYDH